MCPWKTAPRKPPAPEWNGGRRVSGRGAGEVGRGVLCVAFPPYTSAWFQWGKKCWPPAFGNALLQSKSGFWVLCFYFFLKVLFFSFVAKGLILNSNNDSFGTASATAFWKRIWKCKTSVNLAVKISGTTYNKCSNINKKWKEAAKFASGAEAQAWGWGWGGRLLCSNVFQDQPQT